MKPFLTISYLLILFIFLPSQSGYCGRYQFGYQKSGAAGDRTVLHFSEDNGRTWKEVSIPRLSTMGPTSGFKQELAGYLGLNDASQLNQLENYNRRNPGDASTQKVDFLSQGTAGKFVSQYQSAGQNQGKYSFSFRTSGNAGNRNVLHFSEDGGTTWKEVGAPRLAGMNSTSGFKQEVAKFLNLSSTSEVDELLNFNRAKPNNPSSMMFDFLSQGSVKQFSNQKAVNALSAINSAVGGAYSPLSPSTAAAAACASWPGYSAMNAPSSSGGLASVVSKRRMIEFYHHDPSQCDGEANPTNHWLGNFYVSPVAVSWGTFKTSEAAFQAKKCLLLYSNGDPKQMSCIRAFEGAADGEAAFQVSRTLPKLAPNTPAGQRWIGPERDTTMLEVLRAKFSPSQPQLLKALCNTRSTPLHETIPQSRATDLGAMHWGAPPNDTQRKGENMLGKLLEQVRTEAIQGGTCPP
jgi:predicted NAD-dependent protein-ADP-ribosyltransferase YbiA (DUF1768 family)